ATSLARRWSSDSPTSRLQRGEALTCKRLTPRVCRLPADELVLSAEAQKGCSMTKRELIDRVYRKRGVPAGVTKRAVGEIIDGVFAELGDYFIRTKVTKNT